jgi:hypothetical protein
MAMTALERRSARRILLVLVICLIAIRVPTVVAVEHSVISGKSSVAFDPAFNRLGQFAAAHVNDAVFISSDWGSATPLYCNLNGADNTVFETFWGDNAQQGVLNIASATPKKPCTSSERGSRHNFLRPPRRLFMQ